jgi:hypothetical protein
VRDSSACGLLRRCASVSLSSQEQSQLAVSILLNPLISREFLNQLSGMSAIILMSPCHAKLGWRSIAGIPGLNWPLWCSQPSWMHAGSVPIFPGDSPLAREGARRHRTWHTGRAALLFRVILERAEACRLDFLVRRWWLEPM